MDEISIVGRRCLSCRPIIDKCPVSEAMGPGVRQEPCDYCYQLNACHSDSAIYCRQSHPGKHQELLLLLSLFSPSITSSSFFLCVQPIHLNNVDECCGTRDSCQLCFISCNDTTRPFTSGTSYSPCAFSTLFIEVIPLPNYVRTLCSA